VSFVGNDAYVNVKGHIFAHCLPLIDFIIVYHCTYFFLQGG
jgi:hypothetical protein